LDGYVIVTPEYSHGYPGGLKNALDAGQSITPWSGWRRARDDDRRQVAASPWPRHLRDRRISVRSRPHGSTFQGSAGHAATALPAPRTWRGTRAARRAPCPPRAPP